MIKKILSIHKKSVKPPPLDGWKDATEGQLLYFFFFHFFFFILYTYGITESACRKTKKKDKKFTLYNKEVRDMDFR